MRTTDEIVADVCAALNVERVEIRRPERTVECDVCHSEFLDGRCPNACADVGEEPRATQQIVRTAGFEYFGNDRLDVSPRSTDPIGGWFAPSQEIADGMRAAQSAGVPALVAVAFNWFEMEYAAEMRTRFGIVPGSDHWGTLDVAARRNIHAAIARGIEPTPTAWDALLAMREVTLVCTCADATRCHRVLLARILEKLGTRYDGEVQ